MSKSDWHHEWRSVYDELTLAHPEKSPKWRFDEAHRIMVMRRGLAPSVPDAIVKAALGFMQAGGMDMQWDWTKTLWKSVRSAAMVAAAGMVFAFLGGFDTPEELVSSGVPGWLAPAGALAVAALVSFLRNYLAINHPSLNLVKKAGQKIRAS
jgi:hypothetical protein